MMMIGEASARTGVPAKTIRFYEQAGIVKAPPRGDNGYRAYSDNDLHFLRFVQRARAAGFSLKEVTRLLALYRDRRRASRDVKRMALQRLAELDFKIAELTAIRDTIAGLAALCHGDERPDCPILDEFAG